jgi:predicted ArsR family transcriptional regulator
MAQPSLFDDPEPQAMPDAALIRSRPRARRSDPASSHQAAAEVEASGTAARHHRMILEAMRGASGLTSDEIAKKAGLDRVAVARRMVELERTGQIRRGPQRRSNVSGRPGVTWFFVVSTP